MPDLSRVQRSNSSAHACRCLSRDVLERGRRVPRRHVVDGAPPDARIPIHNNASESRLRVVALGRKNFLFFGHPRAGRSFAGLYSLVGSCIANGFEPTAYLTDVLMRVRDANTDEELDALLPDRWRPAVTSAETIVEAIR